MKLNGRAQCNQTFKRFVKKMPKFVQKIAQNGTLLNNNSCPKKLLIKIWELKTKSCQNEELIYIYLRILGNILKKKCVKRQKQMPKFRPIFVTLSTLHTPENV
jgi:hypothetical protein